MPITRRHSLGLIGSALAFPYALTADRAAAAASLQKIGNPFELGSGLPGGNSGVSISVFPNGSYIAGWQNIRGIGDYRAYVRYFSSAGHPVSAEILMGGSGGPTDGLHSAGISPVAYPDGSALVFSQPRADRRRRAILRPRYIVSACPPRCRRSEPRSKSARTPLRRGTRVKDWSRGG